MWELGFFLYLSELEDNQFKKMAYQEVSLRVHLARMHDVKQGAYLCR